MLVDIAARHGRGRYVGARPVRWPMVHVDDLAEPYVRALEADVHSTVLHGIAEEGVDTQQLAAAAAAAAGVQAFEAWPIEDARAELGADFADALATEQVVGSADTRAMLAWSPKRDDAVTDVASGSYARGQAPAA